MRLSPRKLQKTNLVILEFTVKYKEFSENIIVNYKRGFSFQTFRMKIWSQIYRDLQNDSAPVVDQLYRQSHPKYPSKAYPMDPRGNVACCVPDVPVSHNKAGALSI